MARLILPAIGAGLGFMFPFIGPGLGWGIGGMLNQLFFPDQQPDQVGPRLGDLKIQQSVYGAMIPLLFGEIRMAGQMMWSTPKIETRHDQDQDSGKGGGDSSTVTTFTYSASFAIALCDREIVGIRRIYANSQLIYDLGDTADTNSIIASNRAAVGIRIYTGSETQMPDSLIEADKGVGNVPGFRGTAHIVFDNLQLEDYGNSIPNIECVVIAYGDTVGLRIVETSADLSPTFYWQFDAGLGKPIIFSFINGVVRVGLQGAADLTKIRLYDFAGNFLGLDTRTTEEALFLSNYFGVWNNGALKIEDDTKLLSSGLVLKHGATDSLAFPIDEYLIASVVSEDNSTLMIFTAATAAAAPTKWYQIKNINGDIFDQGTVSPALTDVIGKYYGRASQGTSGPVLALENDLRHMWTVTGASQRQAVIYEIDAANNIAEIERMDEAVPFAFAGSTAPVILADRGVAVVVGYNYLVTLTRTPSPSQSAEPLADIFTAILERDGLAASDINVTQVTDYVDGYVIANRMSGRAACEPLMKAFYYDAVESEGKIKFVPRGQGSIVTIPEDDLAAHEYGTDLPDQLSTMRGQEMELPVEVTVGYLDIDADYLPGSQRSRRLITQSKTVVTENLAIAMSGSKAIEIADVLMYDAWTARNSFQLALDMKYAYIEPGDVFRHSKGANTYTSRAVRTNESAGILKVDAVSEDITVYTQSAIAADQLPPADMISNTATPGPTKLMLLDIPLLRDQDDGVGFYAAAAGYLSGWRGAQPYKSADNGVTYFPFGTGFLNAAVMGAATTLLGNFTGGNIFDETNIGTVTVIGDGTLSSTTGLAVLNGANVAVWGDEILQFRDAVLTAPQTYQVSGFLRGRQGTEWAMTTHTATDRFVVLSASTTYILGGTSAEYNLERLYKPVSFGTTLDDTLAQAFTHTAVAQECLSPVGLGGGRDASGNLTINWTRRTRIAGAWNNNSEVPLGEATESYEVDIFSNSGFGTLKRTLTPITTNTVSYSSANQITDFGSNQSQVWMRVYQLSATVGRGYKLEGSV